MKNARRLVTQAGTVVLAAVVGSVVVVSEKIFSLINTHSHSSLPWVVVGWKRLLLTVKIGALGPCTGDWVGAV